MTEDAVDDVELVFELLLAYLEVVVQVKEETEQVLEFEGDGGQGETLFEKGILIVQILACVVLVRACEITSLSWT